jgi:hypothetical protein
MKKKKHLLDSVFGIWKKRKITLNKIRTKQWKRTTK